MIDKFELTIDIEGLIEETDKDGCDYLGRRMRLMLAHWLHTLCAMSLIS
jgi:hypothetical protein